VRTPNASTVEADPLVHADGPEVEGGDRQPERGRGVGILREPEPGNDDLGPETPAGEVGPLAEPYVQRRLPLVDPERRPARTRASASKQE
jgi:hypothetical protein